MFDYYGSSFSNPTFAGITLLSSQGEMTKIDNPAYYRQREFYEFVQPHFFQFLCLRRIGQTNLISTNHTIYETHLQKTMVALYQAYKQYYFLQRNLPSISAFFLPHLEALFQFTTAPITLEIIQQYVNTLCPLEIFYLCKFMTAPSENNI
jgi:hypothetical protein